MAGRNSYKDYVNEITPFHCETLADGSIKLLLVPKNSVANPNLKKEMIVTPEQLFAWMTGERTGNEESFADHLSTFIDKISEYEQQPPAARGAVAGLRRTA